MIKAYIVVPGADSLGLPRFAAAVSTSRLVPADNTGVGVGTGGPDPALSRPC